MELSWLCSAMTSSRGTYPTPEVKRVQQGEGFTLDNMDQGSRKTTTLGRVKGPHRKGPIPPTRRTDTPRALRQGNLYIRYQYGLPGGLDKIGRLMTALILCRGERWTAKRSWTTLSCALTTVAINMRSLLNL